MKKYFFQTLIIAFCGLSAISQQTNFKPKFSVAFDSTQGKLLLAQCSRATPKKVSKFWNISKNNIADLENAFSTIDTLVARQCCIIGSKMLHIEDFAFQYAGIIVKGRKYIYVNAFPFSEIQGIKKYNPDFDPTKMPVIDCDGGGYSWGVLFDVETKKFSLLSFNGMA